ncbi:family 43 glycosylhydrolase [Microbacterium halophytorum]|uniref:family 43 glycosylhydrolase n=1 Tax=Microbacterium halophytorum TaxID=2067568 RepID=UPI00131A2B5C|nr:family 43 glycosylhydrolase [Microbacterium halophytorum]
MTSRRFRHSLLAGLSAAALGLTLVAAPAVAEEEITAEATAAPPAGQLPLTGDLDVHDPTMAYDEAAGLYVLADSHNEIRTAPTKSGPWRSVGEVERAEWTHDVPNSTTLWAPHLQKIGDTFYYYYSQSSFGSSTSAIGVKTTKTPADPSSYVDLGRPVVASGALAEGEQPLEVNAIDPAVIQDADGTWWMTWGSFWEGIVIQQLDDDLTSVVGEPTLLASRQADDNPVEGPAIFERDGYYYLLLSWGKCCSAENSTYKVAVGRSENIAGPYVDQAGVRLDEGGGTVILDSRESAEGVTPEGLYRAPGGGDVFTEDDVNYYVYHAYRPENTLGIRPMSWRDGWPSFRDGDGGGHDLADGSTVRLVSEAKADAVPEVDRAEGPEGFGNAVKLNGGSSVGYVEMPDGIVSGLDADFTISTWVKRGTDAGNDWARIFDFGDDTSSFMFLTPNAAASPTGLRMDLATSDGRGAVVPGIGDGASLSTEWAHVAVTASGTTANLWVDGTIVSTNDDFTLRPADLGETVNNWIGRSQFSADPWLNASIDDFNIFSRALTAGDIAALVAEPGGGDSVGGGDVAWYRFDETGGETVVDSSGSGNDAIAVAQITTGEELQNPVPGTQCLTAAKKSLSQAACDDANAGQEWRLEEAAGNTYRLVSTGKKELCVTLANASGEPGTPVRLAKCKDKSAALQNWFVEDTGHGFLRFSSPAANLALEIENADGVIGDGIVGATRAIRPIANLDPPQQWLAQVVAPAG